MCPAAEPGDPCTSDIFLCWIPARLKPWWRESEEVKWRTRPAHGEVIHEQDVDSWGVLGKGRLGELMEKQPGSTGLLSLKAPGGVGIQDVWVLPLPFFRLGSIWALD